MPADPKQKARAAVRKPQAEFEHAQEDAQRERARAAAIRRKRFFEQAQGEGLTVREIAEEVGLGFGRVAEILRDE